MGATLTVIVPVRNGASTIGAQLRALVSATAVDVPVEVVVVDNGSTDDTVRITQSYADRLDLRVIDAHDVVGANAARNRGVAAAQHSHLLFCDCDDEVDVDWIKAMARAFADGHALVAGPIDYRRLNPPTIQAWRGAARSSVLEVLDFLPTGHFANLGVTRDVFNLIGGCDETFRYGATDIEFCWRAQLAGIELHEAPDAVVHYRLRPTLHDLWRQALSYGASEAHLFRRFRGAGLRRRPPSAPLRDVWWLVTRVPFAASRERRGAWLRRFGQACGRVQGALRYRVLWW